MTKKAYRWLIIAMATVAVTAVVFVVCVWNGIVLLNNPSKDTYPVRGVDVSSYQGTIDWAILARQEGISFAFIKATEGSSAVDPCFTYNYAEAQKTSLRVGAYHFFSFDSAGDTQADNFIRTVDKTDTMLPPVVDLEYYGDKADNPPSAADVRVQLNVLLARLEAHYGIRPILYVTAESYTHYIQGHYSDYAIWYRNVITATGLPDVRDWTFWQYTNRARLDGYDGREQYIDMTVFYGDAATFATFGK